MNPDAWLDEPLPWEMPPPGSDESRRGEAPWEPSSPRHEKPKQRTDFPASRQESKKTERRESGRDWEDLPSLYDEMEGLDSPRARVKGRRTRGVRSRNRHRKR
ncbi:hypothetical protein [Desmospora profundinema]|uniref:Uncharacterized protein n=1 Tax=Desmospora profundinema TaxID=1571184 RepID=A0ABU1IRD2_9BACL|nr:hypothetical protein [Desmospora profundinema]MDR6227256.1 hypothetical protein [Desmospora profundinema]